MSPLYFSFFMIPRTVGADHSTLFIVKIPFLFSSLAITLPPAPSKYLLKIYLTAVASSSTIFSCLVSLSTSYPKQRWDPTISPLFIFILSPFFTYAEVFSTSCCATELKIVVKNSPSFNVLIFSTSK